MCICGLAIDFYEDETDETKKSKYVDIMKDAATTAKLHYSTEHKVFMENALLEKDWTFLLQLGDCAIQVLINTKCNFKINFKAIQLRCPGFCFI